MNMHKITPSTPIGRARLVRMMLSGQTPRVAAQATGNRPQTARKWLARFNAEGVAGMDNATSQTMGPYQPASILTHCDRVSRILGRRGHAGEAHRQVVPTPRGCGKRDQEGGLSVLPDVVVGHL
jgi:hypothetical protein